MSWTKLFERADEYDVTIEDIREALEERRDAE